jgi:hypothetical protein
MQMIRGVALVLMAATPGFAQTQATHAFDPKTATLDTLLRTRGPKWITDKSKHFVLHLEAPASSDAAPAMLDSLEIAWRHAIELLQTTIPDAPQAQVFVTASRTRFARLVAPEVRGLTTKLRDGTPVIIFVRNDSVHAYIRHEAMHLVSFRAWGMPAPASGAWLSEGLGTFADGQCQGRPMVAVARDLLAARPGMTITDVTTHFLDIHSKERSASYMLAGSVVEYLWNSRGRDGVHRLWRGVDSLNESGMLRGLGGDLTAQWRQDVSRRAGSTPGVPAALFARRGCD